MSKKKQRERMAYTKDGVDIIVKAAEHCYTDGDCSTCGANGKMMCIKKIGESGHMILALTIMDIANPKELTNTLITTTPIDRLSTDRDKTRKG